MFDNEQLQQKLKDINYKDFDTLVRFFKWSVQMEHANWHLPLDLFRKMFPQHYSYINSMLHKRVNVKKCIEFMMYVAEDKLYFGDFTWNTEYDGMEEKNKRRQVVNYMNQYFEYWMLVEEHGTLNTMRYHVHYVGLMKKNKTRKELKENWHSFSKCKPVKTSRGVARYLCDYTTKQVPRIRRNKPLIKAMQLDTRVKKQFENAYSPVDYKENEEWKKYMEDLDNIFDVLPF